MRAIVASAVPQDRVTYCCSPMPLCWATQRKPPLAFARYEVALPGAFSAVRHRCVALFLVAKNQPRPRGAKASGYLRFPFSVSSEEREFEPRHGLRTRCAARHKLGYIKS